MALAAASSVISHNRTANSLAFPLSKHGNLAVNHHQHHSKLNLRSFSHPQYVYQCSNGRIVTPSCLAKAAVSDVQLHNSNLTTAAADNSEWDGFGADFSIEGSPIELPDSVAPEAYREWEVKVYDWQTQCPTLAEPGENAMTYKNIKLLPTVGCEADAATCHNIDERNIGDVDNKVSAFRYQSSWYGPFRNGDQLDGCAIRDSAFASIASTKASDVAGVWLGPNAVVSFDGSGDVSVKFSFTC
ncbi:hypothetical protein CRYUN_Cryun18bG0074500 [Craigia yunnanensis]